MELTFDPYSWLRPARDSVRGDANGITRPEWHALAARLAAAHAFQRHGPSAQSPVVGGGIARGGSSLDRGSFHPGTARVLASFLTPGRDADPPETLPFGGPMADAFGDQSPHSLGEAKELDAVNPTSSADSKDTSGMGFPVAGPFPSGNRGLT